MVSAGGDLALDWRLLLFSLLAAGTTTGLILIKLVRESRRWSASENEQAGRSAHSLDYGSAGRLAVLGRVTTGALIVAALSGLIIVSATNAPFFLGPVQILPATGRIIASLLLSLGGLSALRNTRLMSRLLSLLSRRRR